MKATNAETPCFLTNSHDAIVISDRDRRGKPLQTVICTESGLVYTDPRPSTEAITRFYQQEYRTQYKKVPLPRTKHVLRGGLYAKRRLERLSDWVPAGSRILDVGSGGGEFVFLTQQAGYQSQGIEPDPNFVQFSIDQYDIPVHCAFYQNAELNRHDFDCITLFHVLEHFEHPLHAIGTCANWLKVGGRLVVEVPDVEYCGIAPQHRWHFGHLYNFNLKTLAATGLKSGLQVVEANSGPGTGNITTVFQKTTEACLADEDAANRCLQGSFSQTYQILSQHSVLRHYANGRLPLDRMAQKTVQYSQEYLRLISHPFRSYRHLLLNL